MKIRLTNPFLFVVGTALLLGTIFIHKNPFVAFLGGGCFGLIFLNYKEEKNNKS